MVDINTTVTGWRRVVELSIMALGCIVIVIVVLAFRHPNEPRVVPEIHADSIGLRIEYNPLDNISKSGNLFHDIGMLTQALETLDRDFPSTTIQCQSLVRDFRRMVKQYDAVEEYPPNELKRLCDLIHDISHKVELKTQHDLLVDQLDDVDKIKIRELRAEIRGLLAGISYCEE